MVVGSLEQDVELVIIGGGPGGYIAAIRAAALGLDVLLIDEQERLGGTCLLEGCIPSKALISAVEIAHSAREASSRGISFEGLSIDIDKLRSWTKELVLKLSGGIDQLLERRGVEVLHGRARFTGPNKLSLEGSDVAGVNFEHAIIATGSRVNYFPPAGDLPVWTSREALSLPEIPEQLLVVGGGYIGLELGQVYAGLGSQVTMVEFFPRLLTGADPDLVKVVLKRCNKQFKEILVESRVQKIHKDPKGFMVDVEHEGEVRTIHTDKVLVAVGRKPNTDKIGLETTGVEVDEQGFIIVDETGRTKISNIYAIGDVTPGPMLAHKASREAKVAAEVLAGHPSAFDNRAIPAVVFTDPEIAWTGLTEVEAKERSIPVEVGRFPLSALGRARTLGRTDGLVKIISAPETKLILGVGMVGPMASELIAEGTLAIEMGATLEDLLVTIHPHPTLSEALMEAAEVAAGAPIHVMR